jgi:hypothetical protein
MPEFSFTLDAVIVLDPGGQRWRHHRERDHTGADRAIYVMLDRNVGPYGEGTNVQLVIEDLYARLLALESCNHYIRSFTLDAEISNRCIILDAIICKPQVSSFTLDAEITRGGSFTLDAWISGGGSFTLDAVIA